MGPGGLMYAPSRDIAYNYPSLILAVRNAINEDYWPKFMEIMEQLGASFEDLDAANIACSEYLNRCCNDPDYSPRSLLEEVGWFDIHPAAQMTWFAMMGSVMMVQLFHAVRSTSKVGENRADVIDVVAACREARRIINATTDTDELLADLKEVVRRLKQQNVDDQKIREVLNI